MNTVDRLSFSVPGEPVGKGRPRFVRATGHTYTPDATVAAEDRVRDAWLDAGSPRLHPGPVYVSIAAFFTRPQDHFTKTGALSKRGRENPHCVSRYDVDNLGKLVMDSLNGRAYLDDTVVVHATLQKAWEVAGPRTVVRMHVAPAVHLAVAA